MAASPAAVPDPQTIAGILAEVKEAAKSSCPPASFRAMQGALLAWTVDGCEPGGWHWFCSAPHSPLPSSPFATAETAPLVPPLATFLLTLFAYNVNPSIARFRASLAGLLSRCPACVRGYVAAKRALEDQYLRDQSADRVAAFMRTLTQWEASLLGDAALVRWTEVEPTVRLLVALDSTLASHPDIGRVIATELTAQAASDAGSGEIIPTAGVDYGTQPIFGEGVLSLLLPVRGGPSTNVAAHESALGFAQTLLPPRGSILPGANLVESLPSLERLLSLATSPQTTASPAEHHIWRALHDFLARLAPSALDAILTGGDGSLQVNRNERWLDDYCAGGSGEGWAGLVGTLCTKLGLSSATTDAAFQQAPEEAEESWLENLRCFALVLQHAQAALWLPPKNGWLAVMRGRRAPDPLCVLDSIMGSHALLTRLSTQPVPPTAGISDPLSVFLPFVRSLLRPMPAKPLKAGPFEIKGKDGEVEVVVLDGPVDEAETLDPLVSAEAVKKAVWFLCENLQHPRFGVEVRTAAMAEGIKVLEKAQEILKTYPADHAARRACDSLLDIHSATLSTLACGGKEYREAVWAPCRQRARHVVSEALNADSAALYASLMRLAKIIVARDSRKLREDGLPLMPLPVRIRASLWAKIYEAIGPSDLEATAMLVLAVTKVAHLDVLPTGSEASKAWAFNLLEHTEQRRESRKTVEAFNAALGAIKGDRFASMLERFANSNPATRLAALWNMPGLTAAATVLFLSPLEDIHNAVQTLVQETFDDVNDRADCFRALLTAMPEEGLRGLNDFLTTFIDAAYGLPEANAMAKWMVLCLTDVVDVLCRGARSLFRDARFVDVAGVRSQIPKLWRFMSRALSLLFKYTPHWAEHFDVQAMTEWMRDALIFARAMVEQTRTFEGAAVDDLRALTGESWQTERQASPAKLGKVGKLMVEALKDVLSELLAWLRLTDQEILHQAFELIKLLLDRFHRADVAPGEGVQSSDKDDPLVKLPKFIQRRTGYRCKLGDSEMAELSEMLSWWEKFDEDTINYEGEEVSFNGVTRSARPTPSGSSSRAPSDDEFDGVVIDLTDKDLQSIDAISRKAAVSAPKLKQTTLKPVALPRGKSTGLVFTKPTPAPASTSSSSSSRMSFGSTKAAMKSKPSGPKTQAMKNLRSEFRSTVAPPKGGLKAGFRLGGRVASEVEPPRRNRWQDTGSSGPSDEGSSSDDESESRGLAGLASAAKAKPTEQPRKMAAPVRRAIKMAGDDVLIRNPQQVRRDQREAARRTKLRLKPDMEDLHRQILRWDPRATGDRPPEAPNTRFRPLPNHFASPQEYVDVLQPLFMLESWAQLQKGIEDNQNEARIAFDVLGKSVVDDWVDVEVVVPSGQIDQRYRLSEVDIVLVSGLNPTTQATSSYARVTVFKKTFQDVQITLRFHNSANLTGFAPRSKWKLQKIMNLSTMHREWASLKGMPYYDSILPAVLQGQSHPIVEASRHDVRDAMDAYAVNEPQARAILGAMSRNASGFVLIQGPPGTGKTKTIGGLVGKFLSDRPAPAVNLQTNRDGTMANGGGNNGGQQQQQQPPTAAKLLVCAPSNAAIDEVCRRLKEGLRSASGKMIFPKVVRMGHEDSMNIAVKDVSLDELIDQKLKDLPAQKKGEGAAEVANIRQELDALQLAKNETLEKLRAVADDAAATRLVEEELRRIGSKRSTLAQKLNKAKDQQRDSSRALDAARRKARYEVIAEADVICSTLSGAGHDLLSDCDFETVIIDEAAQAVELSALIPLKYNCKRCIMVGDPNQLPPTVLSRKAEDYRYSESMFVRVQRQAPRNVHLLSIQYRMHPDISILPSRVFYDGKLADGPGMAQKTFQPWHATPAFAPYRFFNVDAGRESAGNIGHSLKNTAEAQAALAIYVNLKQKYPETDFDFRIGIVTMYKEQKRELIRVFSARYGRNIVSTVDFNTVDGFQGQEKDIIILSCVRAGGPAAGVGFLKDSRRMNVALTRAKSSLFILGHAPTLEGGGPQWNGIVVDARQRNALFNYSSQIFNTAPRIMATAGPPSVHDVVLGTPYLKRPLVPTGPSSSVVPAKRPSDASSVVGSSLPAKVARLGDPNADLHQMMMSDDDPYPNRGAPSPSPPPPEPAEKAPPLPSTPASVKKPAILSKPPPADLRKLGSRTASGIKPAASSLTKAAPNGGGLRPPPKAGAPSAPAAAVKTNPPTHSSVNGLASASAVQHLLKKPGPPKLNLAKRPAPKQDSLFMPTKRKAPAPGSSSAGGPKLAGAPMSARERLNASAKNDSDPTTLAAVSRRSSESAVPPARR